MKITHIINNDKFSVMAYAPFEAEFPSQNEFILFNKPGPGKRIPKTKTYSRACILMPALIRKIVTGDVVVFHGMSPDNIKILRALDGSQKTIWIGWGYDYYDLIPLELLKEKTLAISKKIARSKSLETTLKNIIKKGIYRGQNAKPKHIERIDIFSPVLQEDYDLVCSALPDFSPKYASWNYGTLEDDLIRGFEGLQVNGDNILLGNSASFTCNHLDAFDNIDRLDMASRKIIAPLSYGDTSYRDAIISAGEARFGASFAPLTDFMPIDDYISTLRSCSIVIMPHLRQQALGNIVISMYLGAKIFLEPENTIFKFFKKQGAFIFAINELEDEYKTALSQTQIAKNRALLKSHWGRSVIQHKTRSLVQAALDRN